VTRLRLPALYAIVDPLDTGADPVRLGQAMLDGGARLLQLRLKRADTRVLVDVGHALREATRRTGALFLLNDRPDVARAVAADGVHLGQEDVPAAVARRVLGPSAIVGISTHDHGELTAALAADPDYVAVGPVYATGSKEAALPPRGLAIVSAARRRTALPLVAIGGITAETAAAVRDAGADSVAMIGALVRAPEVAAATRTALAALARPSV
jgi:thiamine-phosphate pyrophosphorylase